jgi:hypothetical protein
MVAKFIFILLTLLGIVRGFSMFDKLEPKAKDYILVEWQMEFFDHPRNKRKTRQVVQEWFDYFQSVPGLL